MLRFIGEAIARNGRVLIHCQQGKSRSPTVACAYLIWHHRLTVGVALEMIRKVQPGIDPNLGFVSQLQEFSNLMESRKAEELTFETIQMCVVTE